MARDLTVVLDDRPGLLAKLGEAAGEAGVNLRGMAAFTGEGRGIIHVQKRLHPFIALADALEKVTGQSLGGDFAPGQEIGQLDGSAFNHGDFGSCPRWITL